ncbi:cupin [Frateuria aurantia]
MQPTSTIERSTPLPAAIADDARYYEYSTAANPIGAGLTSKVPYHEFAPSLYADGPSRIVRLDLSAQLGSEGPATGPGLCASFIRVLADQRLTLDQTPTSQILYVQEGQGQLRQGDSLLPYATGDFLAFPGGLTPELLATETSRLYYVNDAPLLRYLGAKIEVARFNPTRYPAARAQAELARAAADSQASRRSRVSILLGNRHFPQTRTVTHVLWAMFGMVPPQSVQKPHRHQSIALDFIVQAPQGCYTLVGTEIDADGQILHPTRVDWVSGMAFVTPPGYWHAHYNTTDQPAHLIPIQDAGLQTWLRSLDIRFAS